MILHLSLAPCEIFDVLLGKFQIHRFQCSQNLQEHKVPGYGSSEAGLVAKISLKSILTSFPCVPPSGDKATPACPAPPHILCFIPSGHQAGQTLCKRKGDYLCFAGLADEEWESPHPASSKPGEGLGAAGGRFYQCPRQQQGWPRGPRLHGCIVASPGPAKQQFPWALLLCVGVLWARRGHGPPPWALGSWTVIFSAETACGQGTQQQASPWLRTFQRPPRWLAVLQRRPCWHAPCVIANCRSACLHGAGNTWQMLPVLNSADFLRLQLHFFCLSLVSIGWPMSLLAFSLQRWQNCWSYFFPFQLPGSSYGALKTP